MITRIRDIYGFGYHRLQFVLSRLIYGIRFISPPKIREGRADIIHTQAALIQELPDAFRKLSRGLIRGHARFAEEQAYLFSPEKDLYVREARFIELRPGRFVDVGNQKFKRWPSLEHPMRTDSAETVSLLVVPWGTGAASYGDFLIQVLPKLARILASLSREQRESAAICLPFFRSQSWALRYLELLGIAPERICDESRILKVPTDGTLVLGSGPRSQAGIAHPDDVRELLNQIKRNLPPATDEPNRKLYISRKTGRKMANESEIAEGLTRRGYEMICLEDYSLEDQIRLFQQAWVIVGPHGAGHANIMWCSPGTHLVEIFHPSWMHPCYAILSRIKGLQYHCLVGHDGMATGHWDNKSYFGIFQHPSIDPTVLFRTLDTISQPS
jgi:hypothetical protein